MASTSTVKRLSAVEQSPNWLEMPHDLMANILERLGDAEILNSAQKVCTTWWRICKEPAMWKVINMQKPDGARDADYDLKALTKQAVNLSCGELIDIRLEGFGTNDLLDHIVLRSSKLNSLSLNNCNYITINGLSRALKKVPQLEKLHMSYTYWMVEDIEDIVRNCPRLKSFKLDKACIYVGITNDNDALAIAKNMPELRHLELYGNLMTNDGLLAILDGCPHLESLDIRTCYNINIYDEIKLRLERIKSFKGPQDSIDDCGFHPRTLRYVDFDDFEDYEDDTFNFYEHEHGHELGDDDVDIDLDGFASFTDYFIDYYTL